MLLLTFLASSSSSGALCSVEILSLISAAAAAAAAGAHCTTFASWTSLLSHKLQICPHLPFYLWAIVKCETIAVWSHAGWYGVCLREERPVTPSLVLLAPLTGRQALLPWRPFLLWKGINGFFGILAHCWHLVLSRKAHYWWASVSAF